MKHLTTMLMLAITLLSCKKQPDLVVTQHPTPDPIPCNVSFYSLTPYGNMTLTINGSKYVTGEIINHPSCEDGFIYHSYVGRTLEYSFKSDLKANSGTLLLQEGCNAIELK